MDEIVGKQRPRFDPRSKRTYTPKKTVIAESTIREAWRKKYGDRFIGFDGIVRIWVTIKRPLAKSNPKFWKGRADGGKPDADNVLKLVLDALNGVAYADDSHIEMACVTKLPRVSHDERPEIKILVEYYTEVRSYE